MNNSRRADYEMQPSFHPDSSLHDRHCSTKMSGEQGSPLLPQGLTHMRQLQEQRQLHSVLNDSYLSMSPMLSFSGDSLLDLGNAGTFSSFAASGVSGNFTFGPTSTDDDAVVGSPPSYPPELMLGGEGVGFYMDRCITPDPSSWNRCFEEFDREIDPEDGCLSIGDKLSGGQHNQLGGSAGGDPTLAALNASRDDQSVLDDLDLDDLPLPDEIECRGIRMSGLNTPTNDSQDGLMSSLSLLVGPSVQSTRHDASGGKSDSTDVGSGTLLEMLVRNHSVAAPQVAAAVTSDGDWRSADVKVESEVKVEEETKEPLLLPLSTPDNCSGGDFRGRTMRPRTSTVSSRGSLMDGSVVGSSLLSSETSQDGKYETRDDSHDEGFDSDCDDSDRYSDAESTSSWEQNHRSRSPNNNNITNNSSTSTRPRRKERFFWQYNLQAKGPKGNRMPLATDQADPHQLDEVTDPVFSPNCQVKGIKHTGKARRGDGNDLTPNPCKLHQIGEELKKLSKVIDDLTPVGELPFSVRPKSRKEKNKLASRACRLKKKAQHEANKIKLYGLEQEHRRLMFTLTKTKAMLKQHIECVDKNEAAVKREVRESLENRLDAFAAQAIKSTRVAGNTIDFVNKVLAKVSTNGRSVSDLEQE